MAIKMTKGMVPVMKEKDGKMWREDQPGWIHVDGLAFYKEKIGLNSTTPLYYVTHCVTGKCAFQVLEHGHARKVIELMLALDVDWAKESDWDRPEIKNKLREIGREWDRRQVV